MTIIRLITNNYLQTLCSLSSSCGETELNIALQNPLPSPTRILLLSVSLSLYPSFSLLFLHPGPLFIPSVIHVVLFQSPSIFALRPARLCPPFSALHPLSASGVFPPHISLLKSQHPVYLCAWRAALHLPPLSGLSLTERLTIPSASPLIYHPNGGYKGEKNNNLLREKQPQKGKESVWIATVDRVPACQPVYLREAGGTGPLFNV